MHGMPHTASLSNCVKICKYASVYTTLMNPSYDWQSLHLSRSTRHSVTKDAHVSHIRFKLLMRCPISSFSKVAGGGHVRVESVVQASKRRT